MITGKELNYLTALLNSRLFKFCFKEHFPELLGETREIRKVFFESLQIKSSFDGEWFLKKVQEISNKKLKAASTKDLELEIDMKLFDHYGLSKEEQEMILNIA